MIPALAALLAVVFVTSTPLMSRVISMRVAAQPVPAADDDERAVVALVEVHRWLLGYMQALEPQDFRLPQCAARWRRAQASSVQPHSARVPRAQRAVLRQAIAHGSRILDAAEGRGATLGTAPVAGLDDPNVTPHRPVQQPNLRRALIANTLAAAGTAAALWQLPGNGMVWWLGVVAVVVLAATCVVIAAVDIETYFVDYPVLATGGGLAGALTVASTTLDGNAAHLLATGIVVAALWVTVSVTDFIHSRLRGAAGLGGGDPAIALVTIAIPTMLSADLLMAPLSLVCTGMLALLGYAAVAVTRSHRAQGHGLRAHPLPLGPALALAWPLAWVLLAAAPNFAGS